MNEINAEIVATIKPCHLHNIRTGKKLWEIRKTIPHNGMPFKVFCCESGSGGKVKAEFVVDMFEVAIPRVKSMGYQVDIVHTKKDYIDNFYHVISRSKIPERNGKALDETKRLDSMRKRGKKASLLEKYGYTESMAYDLCNEKDMLSPIYAREKRNGCWFCPNQTIKGFAHIKQNYPHLWSELEKLDEEKKQDKI